MPRKRDQRANFCHDFGGTNDGLMGLGILEHEQLAQEESGRQRIGRGWKMKNPQHCHVRVQGILTGGHYIQWLRVANPTRWMAYIFFTD